MMKKVYLLALTMAAPVMVLTPIAAQASAPAADSLPASTPPQAPRYSVEETAPRAMLADPPATDGLAKHIPAIVGSDQIQMARGMTLKQLQQYAGDMLSEAKMADIQADLNKLPAKK